MDQRRHWDTIYRTKDARSVSWFQPQATQSVNLIARVASDRDSPIIDVGGGASVLVDDLVTLGYSDVTVLDISAAGLRISQQRLGDRAKGVHWKVADVLNAPLEAGRYALWHDRAVFHFLTGANDRRAYVDQVRRAVRPGGYVLVATFAEDGPSTCSGLAVDRYSVNALHAQFGSGFEVVASEHEEHHTPAGRDQSFLYCLCRRK